MLIKTLLLLLSSSSQNYKQPKALLNIVMDLWWYFY